MANLKKPPHSADAEQAVIGSVLMSPAAWSDVSFLRPDEFFLSDHKAIWQELSDHESSRDFVTLVTKCKTTEQRVYIGEIMRGVYVPANAKVYAEHVRNHATMRTIIRECYAVADLAWSSTRAADVLAEAGRMFAAIGEGAVVGAGPRHIHEIAQEWYQTFSDRMNGLIPPGISTGFQNLDERWSGLRGGQVVVIAGRPKTGKTTLALNIAQHIAKDRPVAVFQMEMSSNEVADRAISSGGGIGIQKIRNGTTEGEDLDRLVAAIHTLKCSHLYVDDTPRQTIDYIRMHCKAFVKRYGKGAIMIDYLGLIRSDKRSSNKNDEVAELSRDIKLLAKETDCPVILLCQMNRAAEREKRKPQLSDLRDSGAIEQDADIICFTHKDDPEQNYSEIITRAMRSGQPGTDYLMCDFGMARFTMPYQGWEPPQQQAKSRKGGFDE